MQILFFILGAVALISGVLVVFQTHPLRSALWLIVNFFVVAGIYLLAHAEFIAAIQVIVYAGAIMVLFLFVIMLLNLRQPEATPKFPFTGQKIGGIVLAAFTAPFFKRVEPSFEMRSRKTLAMRLNSPEAPVSGGSSTTHLPSIIMPMARLPRCNCQRTSVPLRIPGAKP